MLKFSAFLRDEKNQSPRSVYNKFENVMSFLKTQGIRGLVGKNDWPRFVEEEPEVYEREELDTLFAACDAQERLWFEFFLMTGMREQEVMHCSWDDINLTRGTVTVRYKPEYGFSPKNYREREIPIPAGLVKELKPLKAKSDKTCSLVFPESGGITDGQPRSQSHQKSPTPHGTRTLGTRLQIVQEVLLRIATRGWDTAVVEAIPTASVPTAVNTISGDRASPRTAKRKSFSSASACSFLVSDLLESS
jgi:integrase